ncbi:dnaJ homolog subfamily C member 14 isoform X1 [Erpetoichthys calabaricus]|uniref:J domain-containing protein n=1 Tax=Erpetoichthys calabaricus TaxID=27687 RepID=A0A8C4SP21_ERPCA|nr:dnaJ homolog subfamily C member 14 isoform X1 [Erpetoichthys calabaricus]XP_028653877.1 dnaJ homolog subfamily C member 14 isoform X1 [Erpetoichthys calabaricus]
MDKKECSGSIKHKAPTLLQTGTIDGIWCSSHAPHAREPQDTGWTHPLRGEEEQPLDAGHEKWDCDENPCPGKDEEPEGLDSEQVRHTKTRESPIQNGFSVAGTSSGKKCLDNFLSADSYEDVSVLKTKPGDTELQDPTWVFSSSFDCMTQKEEGFLKNSGPIEGRQGCTCPEDDTINARGSGDFPEHEEGEQGDLDDEQGWSGSISSGFKEGSINWRKGGVSKKARSQASTHKEPDLSQRQCGEAPSSRIPTAFNGAGKQKHARRRNTHPLHQQQKVKGATSWSLLVCWDLLQEAVGPWCLACFRMVVDLIVFVTHRCGEYVEVGGTLAYSCCSELMAQGTDLGSLQGRVWNSARWVQCRAQKSLEKLHKSCRWLVSITYRLFKMLLALVFLVLMLSIGCLRLFWRWLSSGFRRLMEKCFGPLDQQQNKHNFIAQAVDIFQNLWNMLRETRTWVMLVKAWQKLWAWVQIRTAKLWGPSTLGCPESPSSGAASRYEPGQELERLLAMASMPEEEVDPFKVLGVESNASDSELKKAYRQLAVLVHPDKNKHPRAEEAFKVLRAAWDIVSNPESRREYEMKRMAESEITKSMNEFLAKLQDDLREAMNTMMCSKCEGKHKRFEMDREPAAARYCGDCKQMHAAEEGDFWAESSMLGLRITYFALMDGKVYDITEWAGCQRIGISPDTHRVPYHISFGSRSGTNSGRHRTPSEGSPGSAADLQDILNRIFQGSPNQMPNGGFFCPPPPPGSNTSTSSPGSQNAPGFPFTNPPSGPSRADNGVRTDSSKARRKKKARRPFPR